jgi:hypothetical protein
VTRSRLETLHLLDQRENAREHDHVRRLSEDVLSLRIVSNEGEQDFVPYIERYRRGGYEIHLHVGWNLGSGDRCDYCTVLAVEVEIARADDRTVGGEHGVDAIKNGSADERELAMLVDIVYLRQGPERVSARVIGCSHVERLRFLDECEYVVRDLGRDSNVSFSASLVQTLQEDRETRVFIGRVSPVIDDQLPCQMVERATQLVCPIPKENGQLRGERYWPDCQIDQLRILVQCECRSVWGTVLEVSKGFVELLEVLIRPNYLREDSVERGDGRHDLTWEDDDRRTGRIHAGDARRSHDPGAGTRGRVS